MSHEAYSCSAVFVVEDEADDDIRPSSFVSELAREREGDWGLQEAERIAKRYKVGNALVTTSKEKRQLPMNEYWLVPVRVGVCNSDGIDHCLRLVYHKVGTEWDTTSRMNELLPESMRAHCFAGLQGRVYVSAPEGSKAVETLRARVSPVSTAYVHRRLYRLSVNESDDIGHFIEGRRLLKQDFQIGSWVKIVRGFWKGDIARVYQAEMGTDVIVLQVVPRLPKENLEEDELRSSDRPEPALFDLQTVPLSASGNEFDVFEGPLPDTYLTRDGRVFFRNGLQYLRVMARHYVKHYEPTAAEVSLFTLAGIRTLMETNRAFLNAGDMVFVRFGDDVEYRGRVRSRTERTAVVDVEEECVDDWILSVSEFTLEEVDRVLQVGCCVDVRIGILKGMQGIVVRSKPTEEFVTVFSPERMKQVCDVLLFLD